jgi:GTP cyclohydrolase I
VVNVYAAAQNLGHTLMLDTNKTDGVLGAEVGAYLRQAGVETPLQEDADIDISPIESIQSLFAQIMHILGLDLTDDSLRETPRRVAKMYYNELFWGLSYSNFPRITTVQNKMQYDEMVIEKDIKVISVCEHHFVTIFGKAHVAYIPSSRVLGLSKINRVVEFFCRRPQIQERLTEQIYYALSYILDTEDIAVVIEAEHFCVKARGVEDTNSVTITSKIGGKFFNGNGSLRQEFLRLIR